MSENEIRPRGLSVADAGRRLGCCKSTVYSLINSGKLRARKIGDRTILLLEDVDRFLDEAPPFEPGSVVVGKAKVA